MRKTPTKARLALAAGALLLLLGLVLTACGGDDQEGAKGGNRSEQAFLQAMTPHHESAIEMANVAKQRGQHTEIEDLAVDIVAAQSDEIRQMGRIHRRLFRVAVRPDPRAHDVLGLSADQAGMMHMDSAKKLERAEPFDHAFIDEMVPHHQGAIRMAQAVLGKTEDRELRTLAGNIVKAQKTEIVQMNRWRTKWYGASSPAGGVPGPNDDKSGVMQEHQGH